MNGRVMGRGQLLGPWLGIAAAWGAALALVLVLGVEPRAPVLAGLSFVAIGAAFFVARRHALRSRRSLITPRDLWRNERGRGGHAEAGGSRGRRTALRG